MPRAQAFAESYAEELRYRTKAKIVCSGPAEIPVTQGMKAVIPCNTVRVKYNVHECLVTFGKGDVTLSGSDGDGRGYANPCFSYDDAEMFQKLDKAIADKGIPFHKTSQEWKKHKGIA